MTYVQAMAWIGSFSRSGAPVQDLSRIAGLMHRLGDPQDQLRFLHIAGTNGKGSVAEYLTNILIESGYRTGTFTSPYILRYNDRIRLDREEIPDDALAALCAQIMAHVTGEEGYSQFEITFAIAMLYYVQQGAELVVLETGMGGLLDCTNIIREPLVSIITSVSCDHMAVLGNTIDEIAAQKAGIMKPGCPAVLDIYGQAKRTVFEERARELGCELHWREQMSARLLEESITGCRFLYEGTTYRTRMGGAHQLRNAVTAITAAGILRRQGLRIPEEAVQSGIAQTQVPGRLQILSHDPLIVLDGCHNRDGIAWLCETLRREDEQIQVQGGSPLLPCIGIVGMTHADAVDAAAAQLSACLGQVLCVDGFAPGTVPAETLVQAFAAQGTDAQCVPTAGVLKAARDLAAANNSAVVICGSLYLASACLTGVLS